MFDLLELLLGLLDVLDMLIHAGDVLRHWRLCFTFGLSIILAVFLHRHIQWETLNSLISIFVGVAGLVVGIIWEFSGRRP